MSEQKKIDQPPQTMEDAFAMLDLEQILPQVISKSSYEKEKTDLMEKAKKKADFFEEKGQVVDFLKIAQMTVETWCKEKQIFFQYQRYRDLVDNNRSEEREQLPILAYGAFARDEALRVRFKYIERNRIEIGAKVRDKNHPDKIFTISAISRKMYLVFKGMHGSFSPFGYEKISE